MAVAERIRNIALLGHSSCGKTSLAEAMLYMAGATTRKGDPAAGTSILDFEEEEKEKKITINGATAFLNWRDHTVHIVDLPGYLDFLGEIMCGLMPVETGILCIDLASGIKVTTRKVWEMMGKMGLSRVIVLTKVDQEPEKIGEMVAQIQEAFGTECVAAVHCEDGKVVPLLEGGPEDLRTKFIDKIVETNEELMERYLGGEEVGKEELLSALKEAIKSGEIVPVLATSATTDAGVKELLDFVVDALPSPLEPSIKKARKGEEEVDLPVGEDKPFLARVFKIVTDPYVGKLAFFRVYAGSVSVGDTIHNPRTGRNERIGALYKTMGKEQKQVEKLTTGELGAVSKIEEIKIGDTLCWPDEIFVIEPPAFTEPMVSYAVIPKSRGDEEKISTALSRLAEEDPTFIAKWEHETGELVIRGNSTLHLDVMMRRLKRRFGVEIETRLPKIPYRETVMARGEGHYKHKKQTGGRGQYGEVYLRVEPLERGKGYEFVDAVVGGVIPRQFIPSVEKGVLKAMEKGVMAGFPVQDVKVTVYDGSHHVVDSDDYSFRLAGERAFHDGMEKAKPVLLEPIVDIEIVAPTRFMGDIISDLNSRRARITGTEMAGDQQVIRAKVPLAEVLTYSTQLRSITGGEGTYTITFSHYDVVPPNIAQQIVEQVKAEKEQQK